MVLGLVVSIQRQEMNKSLKPAVSVDAPIASVFHFVRHGRRATDQRWLGQSARNMKSKRSKKRVSIELEFAGDGTVAQVRDMGFSGGVPPPRLGNFAMGIFSEGSGVVSCHFPFVICEPFPSPNDKIRAHRV